MGPHNKRQVLSKTRVLLKGHPALHGSLSFHKLKSIKKVSGLYLKKKERKKKAFSVIRTNDLSANLGACPLPSAAPWPRLPACSPDRCRLQWQTPSSTWLHCDLSVHQGKEWLRIMMATRRDYISANQCQTKFHMDSKHRDDVWCDR